MKRCAREKNAVNEPSLAFVGALLLLIAHVTNGAKKSESTASVKRASEVPKEI